MKRFAWGCLLAICMPVSGGTLVENYDSALDGSSDTILSRAFVPSDEKRHGEVRLVRRSDGLVVQTLLYTKLLKRAVAKIRQKEQRHWPADSAGHEDSLGYIDAIESVQQEIAEHYRESTIDEDRRRKMLIEFIDQPGATLVALYEPGVEQTEDGLRITGKQPLAIIEPSRHYVFENMKLIVADSLEIPNDEIEVLFSARQPATK